MEDKNNFKKGSCHYFSNVREQPLFYFGESENKKKYIFLQSSRSAGCIFEYNIPRERIILSKNYELRFDEVKGILSKVTIQMKSLIDVGGEAVDPIWVEEDENPQKYKELEEFYRHSNYDSHKDFLEQREELSNLSSDAKSLVNLLLNKI